MKIHWLFLILSAVALPAVVSGQNTKFDPHDLSGKWVRNSNNQGFSNVPETGRGNFPEAPFTPAGKAAYEKNYPGYGPRANATLRNDPMGTCDPLGIPRNLNAEVVSSHNWWEIVQTTDRVIQFFEWHHEYRVIYTDGRKLPDSQCRSGSEVERLLGRAGGRAIRSSWIRSDSTRGHGSTSSDTRTRIR